MSAVAFKAPWGVNDDGDVADEGGELVAIDPRTGAFPSSLIAAAPELYEAGVHALRELDCLAACIYHDDQRQEVQAFADRFRAALAKARGETL